MDLTTNYGLNAYPVCLANISNYFAVYNMKQT